MAAKMTKLPTFNEWLEVRDEEMSEDFKKWMQAAGLATGLGLSALGINNYMNRPAATTTAATTAAATASAEEETPTPYGTSKRVPVPADYKPAPRTEDPAPTTVAPKVGKTFRMKGGHSRLADVKTTVERPAENTWVFRIQGEILPRDAIKQAKDIVQDELGAKTQNGLSAEFNPTDNGMDVTVSFTPEYQRQRMLRGN